MFSATALKTIFSCDFKDYSFGIAFFSRQLRCHFDRTIKTVVQNDTNVEIELRTNSSVEKRVSLINFFMFCRAYAQWKQAILFWSVLINDVRLLNAYYGINLAHNLRVISWRRFNATLSL